METYESNAEQILGFSYDNFKRTIIIPQGKFQEFLQLKETERVQMLKEIFSLEKFELGGRVSKLTKENDLKVSHVHGQMQTLPEYDEELLKEKTSAIALLSKEEENLEKDLKVRNKEELALQTLKEFLEDIKVKTDFLTSLQQKQSVIDELDKRVKAFEHCEQLFKFPIENRNNIAKSLTTLKGEEQKLKENVLVLEESIRTETAKVDVLKHDYSKRDELLKKADELEKVILIQAIDKEDRRYFKQN